MPFRFLNPCNHMSLALNFFFSSSDSEGSSRTNFSILALRYLPSTRIPYLVDLTKRQFTLQLMLFYEDFLNSDSDMPFIKPLIVFKAQPEGYDKNNPNWKGDVM